MFRIVAALFLIISVAMPALAQTKRPVSGVVAASSGEVQVSYTTEDGDNIGRIAGIGDPIYLNDVIRTGPGTKLQILLKDQTVFSIGPDAELIFDEFIYDPSGEIEPALTATVKKGVFKFISGKISSLQPDAMKLNLPNTTASIRGTTVAGRVAENGETELVLLTGAISVTSVTGADPIDIFQSGWGVNVSPDGMVADPFPVPTEVINEILGIASVVLDEGDLSGAAAPEDDEEGDQDEDSDAETGGEEAAADTADTPALTPEQQIVADFTEFATETLAGDGQAEVAVGDLISLLAQDDEIAALFLANGIDVTEAPSINYGYLDTQLIRILTAGGGPVYFRLQDDGGGNYSIDHSGLTAAEAAVLAPPYSGSVRFASSGLELSPQSSATSSSGTVGYDYTLNLDTASVTGTFSVTDAVIDGNSYGSGSTSFTDVSLAGASQASYEGDNNFVLNAGEQIFYVTPATLSLTEGAVNGRAELTISAGSVTDGTLVNTIGGLYGSTDITVFDDNDAEIRSRAEKFEVGRPVE